MKKSILLTLVALVFTHTFSPTLAHARYYDAEVGRFVSPDEVVQNVNDPQTLNRYAYVRNKPTTLVDPDGHLFWVPIIVGAALGAYSAGQATNWNTDYMLKGALVGAVGGAVGAGVGNFATNILGNAFVGGIVGGAAGGASSGYAGAAMFGGNRGLALEQGAKWGAISGGLSQGLTMAGVPDVFSQAGSGYLSGHWQGGDRAAQSGAAYGAAGQILGNVLTMAGVDADGVVPSEDSQDMARFSSSNDTYVTTPSISLKDGNLIWMIVALFSNGTSHTWHGMDGQYAPSGHRFRHVRGNVEYNGGSESYLNPRNPDGSKNYNLITNNCSTRFGAPNPSAYLSRHHYSGHSYQWKYQQ